MGMHVSIGYQIEKIVWTYLKIENYIELELKSESELETQYGAACQRRISDCCHQFHQIAYTNNTLYTIWFDYDANVLKRKPFTATQPYFQEISAKKFSLDVYESIVWAVWADICFDGVCPKFAISPERRREDEKILFPNNSARKGEVSEQHPNTLAWKKQ